MKTFPSQIAKFKRARSGESRNSHQQWLFIGINTQVPKLKNHEEHIYSKKKKKNQAACKLIFNKGETMTLAKEHKEISCHIKKTFYFSNLHYKNNRKRRKYEPQNKMHVFHPTIRYPCHKK